MNDNQFSKNYYAQDGEDTILLRHFETQKIKKGFYVDIGAHHPLLHSNTKIFYDLGWTGINIEPIEDYYQKFLEERPLDINVRALITDFTGKKDFYQFKETAISTSHDDHFELRKEQGFNFQSLEKVDSYTIKDLLDKYLPGNQEITFLFIDTQGYEFKYLKTNDWNKYQPKYVCIGVPGNLNDVVNSETTKYLKSLNYVPIMRANYATVYKLDC